SLATAERRWPTCGLSCTVMPHTYMPTLPGTTGSKDRLPRLCASRMRRGTSLSFEWFPRNSLTFGLESRRSRRPSPLRLHAQRQHARRQGVIRKPARFGGHGHEARRRHPGHRVDLETIGPPVGIETEIDAPHAAAAERLESAKPQLLHVRRHILREHGGTLV